MLKKQVVWLSIATLTVVIATSVAYAFTGGKEEKAKVEGTYKPNEEKGKVVNKPINASVVTLKGEEDVHNFISRTHDFYNDTLAWGRIDSVNHDEQTNRATDIIRVLEGMESTNEALASDLTAAKETAENYLENRGDDQLIRLHRLFHDLDIYFNGYDYHQTFGVTSYKGGE